MSTQVSQQPTMSTTNSFPTPASSVSGHLVNATSAEDADHKSFSPGMQNSRNAEGQQVIDHTRTDHDREPLQTGPQAAVRDFAIGQQATDTDAMDVDKESAPRFDLGLDSLHNDFTSAFHLCKSCKNPLSLITVAAVAVV